MPKPYEGDPNIAWLRKNLSTDELAAELSKAFHCLDKWVTTINNPATGELREIWRESHEVLTEIVNMRKNAEAQKKK